MKDIDLASLAEGYRFRPPSAASLARAEAAAAGLAPESLILDIGGGPGHHAAVWAAQGHRPVILDPAPAMTQPAQARGINVVCAVSQAVPFADTTFDLVWFHLSIQYGDWRAAVDEAVRVTRRGGRIEIWTIADDHHETSMLARWFPSMPAIDRARFPPGSEVEDWLARAGCSVSRTHVVEERRRQAGAWADAVEAGFVSSLQLIDEAERGDGLAAFRTAYPDPLAEIEYQLRFDQVVARR